MVDQVAALLQKHGRTTYRALKLEFDLDDERLDVLKEELIDARELAVDKDGKMLVWAGDGAPTATPHQTPSQTQPPATYTPQHLAERIRAEQAAMESRGSADGERKTITALFADLKGSTALIEGLDPEDARAIIDPALQLMMDAVHRYDGYVAQALGDGIFALFGAPIAHEDHPQRALYAALRMQEEMRGYSDQVRLKHGIPLQMRVGINTGEVVVRSIRKDDLHTDYVPVGHSTNLAARMEQMANPGSIVISEYTRKSTEGYFELKALGAADIKGVEEPLNIYEVVGAGPLRTRLQVSARRGLTRFVGRHSEMEQIQQALDQARAGHGQIVGVMGEPGLGKSRLFYEFKLTSQSGCRVLEAFAVSHGKASPYFPIIELLKTYFQIEPTDDERQRQEKITGRMLTLDRSLEDTLPYLFSLLGIEDPQSSLQQMDAQIRRRRTFEALKELFLRESLNQPLILVFEDLHWIDSETQGFLDLLSESVASAKLVLVNYRPEYRPEWGQKTYYTQLRLAPLGTAEAAELLTFLLGTDASLKALKSLILEKTEGTPFFMEEVVQTLAEDGGLNGERGQYRLKTAPTELHISPTVQGVLAARIDRLTAAEKELLQQLSVIGRQFPVSLVKAVVSQTEDELHQILASLQAKEFLYEQPAFPESEYLFKHALTQDVAYGTVLQETRKALHEQTGHAIEGLYKTSLSDHYSELAHHYRQSDNTAKAVEYLQLAGQQAVQRSAFHEAIELLTAGLTFLQTLPETRERTQQELQLQTTLSPALMAVTSWSSPEVVQLYQRACELCQELGESQHVLPLLWGRWALCTSQTQYQDAQQLAEQYSELSQRGQDSGRFSPAHYMRGLTAMGMGEFQQALDHYEQSNAVYNPQQHHRLASSYAAFDLGVTCQSNAAWMLWILGYPAQAQQRLHDAYQVAHELAHRHTLAWVMWSMTMYSQIFTDAKTTQARAEDALAVATEVGDAFLAGWCQSFRGWTLAQQGQLAEGRAELQRGMSTRKGAGGILWPTVLVLWAETLQESGQPTAALEAVAEGLEFVNDTEEHYAEAELYRLRGELTLQAAAESDGVPTGEAEACFHRALDIARQQAAKTWELRAAMSLARLWQQQGKITEARELLAQVYNWFTEGFDTQDLKDAKTLLEELAEG